MMSSGFRSERRIKRGPRYYPLHRDEIPEVGSGKTYTREGMIKRVIEERREKAEK